MKTSCIERVAELATPQGHEWHMSLAVPDATDFQEACHTMQDAYDTLCRDIGCSAETEISIRFFCSDIANQAEMLPELWSCSPSAFLCPVGQAPLEGRYLALQAYHIKARTAVRKNLTGDGLLYAHGGYTSLLSAVRPQLPQCSREQTDAIITAYVDIVRRHNASLAENVLRTWYYLRDIDNNYAGMIHSRLALYAMNGLGAAKHSIASTGIEGAGVRTDELSWLVALMTRPLAPEQIAFLSAPEYLPPTLSYGVNFEHATRCLYGDRTHIFLSGTASIDEKGEVVHRGDVGRQLDRVFQNMEALLKNGGMTGRDLKSAIVYLRDADDCGRISPLLHEAMRDVSFVVVRAPVCRPAWLVEIEGIAGIATGNADWPCYC